ncbi:MAG: serine hydrolase [Bacteroidetes bacterium]|nr:serine hydrolase [Bacteroidota bacterium]
MKHLYSFLILFFISVCGNAQSLYYPPLSGSTWETISQNDLGWCPDSVQALIDYADLNNSKALIVLKDGKIALEHYFDTFTADSIWYWASAGKSLTAFLTGLAQEQGYLNINDTTSSYLGPGWTSLTSEQEEKITILNQLTMTTGLDDGYGDVDCTIDTCLQYLADPGTRWAYHNAPYTLIDPVIENATGVTMNNFLFTNLSLTTGIFGVYLYLDFNHVFFSTARSMARFGLLCQNNAIWNQNAILEDQDYFQNMVNPSQDLNKSYGYLWWLNGQESFMLPGLQTIFPGMLMPDSPADVYSAIGRDVQCVMISPSTGYVIVRMGEAPDGVSSLVPTILPNMLWKKVLSLDCGITSLSEESKQEAISIYPNPGYGNYRINGSVMMQSMKVFDLQGRIVLQKSQPGTDFHLTAPAGTYIVQFKSENGSVTHFKLSHN